MTLLEVSSLNAGYGKSPILFDLSLEVSKESISAILGPNGSGKSTLLKSIFGLTTIYNGSINFNGNDITGMKPYEIARLGMAYLPQVENTYLNLNVRENLLMAGYILSKEETNARMQEVLDFLPVLKGFLEKKVLTLSGGERQMAIMAMALMRRPALMLFDEPSASLASKVADKIFEKIKELNRDFGMTIVIVEQDTRRALEISDESYLLVSGKVNFHGKSKELAENAELGRLFLGLRSHIQDKRVSV
jgi:branched-chain amino acid transport system ATP-binding protein